MSKLKIAVLFGGCSSEYEISLQSAYSVVTHLNSEKYEPVLLGISKCGKWLHFSGQYEKIKEDTWNNPTDCVPAIISPDRATRGVIVFEKDSVRTIRLDAAMPVLHGKNGEDGTVQGLLELAGIPVAGCKTLASALGMDKDKAHKLASLYGIRTPRSFILESGTDTEVIIKHAESIGYPLFVKPVRAGSSFGITKVTNKAGLPDAVKLAYEYDDRVILEENIHGFEVSCAVMGNDELITGELGEIELADGFFDFYEKYKEKTYSFHVPARVTPHKAEEIKVAAKTVYRTLDCSGFARVDMFLTSSGEIIFNEVNTIPGFTTHSHYPQMFRAAGMGFGQVLDKIIELAVER